MQNIKDILNNPDIYKDSVQKRNIKNCDIDELIGIYKNFNELLQQTEELRAAVNKVSTSIRTLTGDEKTTAIENAQKLKAELTQTQAAYQQAETIYKAHMLNVPNLLPADTPQGVDDTCNVEIRHFGKPTEFSFKPKDHLQIGTDLDILDFDAGTKSTGAKFYFFKNDAVILEAALKRFAFDTLRAKGFYLLKTPDLAKQSILLGSGFNPRGNESNVYNIEDMDLSLIATAEITIGGFLSDTVFRGDMLPLKLAAESHCFRREAGGAGQESKGLYRVHQFDKIEMYAVTKPDQSAAVLEELVAAEEDIYQKLQLPYRVVRICAGDLGAPAYQKYDIEAWMPGKAGKGEYGEITSASNCTDFQARRMNIKYKEDENAKREFAHTLNGTSIAVSRVMLAILENYQQEDGSVLVPMALRKYTGFDKIEKPKHAFKDYVMA